MQIDRLSEVERNEKKAPPARHREPLEKRPSLSRGPSVCRAVLQHRLSKYHWTRRRYTLLRSTGTAAPAPWGSPATFFPRLRRCPPWRQVVQESWDNIRCGAAAPCCDPNVTVASSARRYCGAFTELSIAAALTSTGTRSWAPTSICSPLSLDSSPTDSVASAWARVRGHELWALLRKRRLGGRPVCGPSKCHPRTKKRAGTSIS